jgi:large subunit ribosomal protein L25
MLVLENSMESLILNATPRPETGKGVARKAREAGRTPGVVYRAGGSATPVSFNVSELATIFRKTADPNTLVSVQVAGNEARPCIVREVQRDPVSRNVLHVDFYEVAPDYVVDVDVALAPVGRAAGTRTGGTMRMLARSVRVRCASSVIPRVIEVDVSPLENGEFLKLSQIPQPEGVKFVYQRDANVVAVEGKRTAREEAPAAGAPGAAAAAAPAAKAAAAKPAAKPAAKK